MDIDQILVIKTELLLCNLLAMVLLVFFFSNNRFSKIAVAVALLGFCINFPLYLKAKEKVDDRNSVVAANNAAAIAADRVQVVLKLCDLNNTGFYLEKWLTSTLPQQLEITNNKAGRQSAVCTK